MSIHVKRAPTVPLTLYDTKRRSYLNCNRSTIRNMNIYLSFFPRNDFQLLIYRVSLLVSCAIGNGKGALCHWVKTWWQFHSCWRLRLLPSSSSRYYFILSITNASGTELRSCTPEWILLYCTWDIIWRRIIFHGLGKLNTKLTARYCTWIFGPLHCGLWLHMACTARTL